MNQLRFNAKHLLQKHRIIVAASLVMIVAFSTLVLSLHKTTPIPSACSQGYYALTFDDGPDPITTPIAFRILKSLDVHATFFMLGKQIVEHPELYRQALAEGHAVGVHTWDHKSLTGTSTKTKPLTISEIDTEIQTTLDAMEQAGGPYPIFWRPPFGDTTPQIRDHVNEKFNLIEVGWSVTSRDTFGLSSQQIVDNSSVLKNGGAVLLHDTRLNTVNAISGIVTNLKTKRMCEGRLAPSHIGTTGWYRGIYYARAVSW